MVNKSLLSFALLSGLLLFATLCYADAVVIPNPLGVGSFCELLTNIGDKVGEVVAGIGTIMVIVAGIMFIFSAGNPGRLQNAKTALTYAIVGMAIGLAAKVIVNTVKDVINAGGGSC